MRSITSVIQQYVQSAISDQHHRYHSWDHCRKVFSEIQSTSLHSLHLGFYLASWGMYRGSGGLLQRNHTIHAGPTDIYYSGRFDHLKCFLGTEVDEGQLSSVISLRDAISAYYQTILFKRGNNELRPISATDTLISKIILGTFGCVPAFDDFFIKGLKAAQIKKRRFNEDGLREIFKFQRENREEIEQCALVILENSGVHYPAMKIIDMYFWQIGYDQYLLKSL